MKNHTLLSVLSLFLVLFMFTPSDAEAAGASEAVESSEGSEEAVVNVYCYDSFASEWGPGPHAVKLFKEKTGIDVNLVSAGDAGQVLQRAVLEKDSPQADVILGIDNNLIISAREADILSPYDTEAASHLHASLSFGDDNLLHPFDYGFFSIIYDSQRIDNPPKNLEDLTHERFENSLILMDPRTSSPGLGFLHWTIAEYGDDFLDYWNRLKPSILTITEGWDSGYGLFTQGEAPLVLSYTTSPAYHVEYEDSHRFKAAIFPEGHYSQVEGIGLLKNAEHEANGKEFIDFILSEQFQEIIPLTNWMYPARKDIDLPESYEFAPKAPVGISLPAEKIKKESDDRLQEWSEFMSK
ncbi:MAG: thiamine ABC transporter substrate-binding protein [Spirochaetia bacterium]|nr:thiamine ABC transporter substrate-binding protein [Spirochaetia bacterium]